MKKMTFYSEQERCKRCRAYFGPKSTCKNCGISKGKKVKGVKTYR